MTARTQPRSRLARTGQVFLGSVISAGVVVIVASVYELHAQPVGYQWYMLAALTLVSGSATVKLPSVPASISVSETFVFASVLLFGSAAGTITVALDGLVISFWMAKRRPEWYRALFNMTAPAVSIWFSSQLLFRLAHIQPLSRQPASVNVLLLPLIVFAIVYFGLNSWLIAFAVAFETKTSPYRVWRENFLWLSLNYFSGASVSLLLVVYTRDVDLRFIGVIVPLLLVLYFTFKTSMGRVEDANSHLEQLNRLYLSTIETLAMAIDAKDQITHGHIRRVQILAVGLARKVGVTDERLIRAIEAAALLHDTGKLAVPEHILNKPGRLTPAEFDKMKLHATVGADILTAVDFPYPVVPIVRHHHENWNGSGYPDGLRGTDIPIGARILSVVDCFDALISDRPYRRRLSDEAAMGILIERRGSMYDPLIVDTFASVYREIAPQPATIEQTQRALDRITSSSQSTGTTAGVSNLDLLSSPLQDRVALYRLAAPFTTPTYNVDETIIAHLSRLIPSALTILYMYDATRDDLDAKHIVGGEGLGVGSFRIGRGEKLSGWVAANRQTMINSDPALDLGDIARSSSLRLRSCLSTALVADDQLIGVLTFYSSAVEAFNDSHRRIVELVGPQLARNIREQTALTTGHLNEWAALPILDRLHDSIDPRPSAAPPPEDLGLLLITVLGVKQIHSLYGRDAADRLLCHVVRIVRGFLGADHMLFRSGADELLAVYPAVSSVSATALGERIRDEVRNVPLVIQPQSNVTVDVSAVPINVSHFPPSLREFLSAEHSRFYTHGVGSSPSVH